MFPVLIQTIAREFRLILLSRKGLSLLVLSGLFCALPAMIRIWIEQGARSPSGTVLGRQQARALARIYGPEVASTLMQAPGALVAVTILMVMVAPLFVFICGHEVVSGDIESGVLRLTSLRVPRWALIVGKALGLWSAIAFMAFVVHAMAWVALFAFADHSEQASLLAHGPRLYAAWLLIAFPYVGLTVLLSTVFRSPSVVIAIGLVVVMALWVVRVTKLFGPFFSQWLPPANQEPRLLGAVHLGSFAVTATYLLLWGTCVLAAAWLALVRRDL